MKNIVNGLGTWSKHWKNTAVQSLDLLGKKLNQRGMKILSFFGRQNFKLPSKRESVRISLNQKVLNLKESSF